MRLRWIGLLLFSLPGWGADPDFSAVESPGIEILSFDRADDSPESRFSEGIEFLDPALRRPSFLDWLFQWAPNGRADGAVSRECHPWRLEHELKGLPHGDRVEHTERFLRRCEPESSRFHGWWVDAQIRLEDARYDIFHNERIRPVRITLPDNIKLRGVLALKPGMKPKPLVIVKCGLYCDSEASSGTRVLLTHLFDASPFHVLILSNVTGVRFAEENAHYSLGGFDEGRQLILAAKVIQDSPLGRLASSYHAGGVSLGGHAALFSAVYNGFTGAPRTFNSVAALCPVVDLKSTLDESLKPDLKGRLFRFFTIRQLVKILTFIPFLGDLFNQKNPPDSHELRDVVARGALEHYKKLSQDNVRWTLPPFEDARFETIGDLWLYNDFLSYYRFVRTPTLVWASDDDGVVPTPINGKALADAVKTDPGLGGIRVMQTRYGAHCAFGVSHGWDTFSSVLRSHILENSPEFSRETREQTLPKPPRDLRLGPDEMHLDQVWEVFPGKSQLRLTFQIWSPRKTEDCWRINPGDSGHLWNLRPEQHCLRTVSMELELPAGSLFIPRNEAEAQAATRWANSNLRVVTSTGEMINYGVEKPYAVRWESD